MSTGEFLTALGYLVGALIFWIAACRRRIATEGMGMVALAGLVGGVLGAKITEWGASHGAFWATQPTAILNPHLGGRTILGGILCGWLAVEAVKRYLGIRRSTGDLFALSVSGGEVVGRIGCLFNGCCYGTSCQLPWAIYQHGAWRHPSQIYLAIGAGIVFAIMWAVQDRLPHEGDAWKLYLVLGGLSRFVMEFFRERQLGALGLSTAQWTCLAMIALGAWLLKKSWQQNADPSTPNITKTEAPALP